MFLGRYQLGDLLPLAAWTRTGDSGPILPTSAPAARIYSSTGFVKEVKVPICDRFGITAFFQGALKLDGEFSPGQYSVLVTYTAGGVAMGEVHTFEVVGGGHLNGAVISLHVFRVAPATWAIAQCSGGRVIRKKNPRVTA